MGCSPIKANQFQRKNLILLKFPMMRSAGRFSTNDNLSAKGSERTKTHSVGVDLYSRNPKIVTFQFLNAINGKIVTLRWPMKNHFWFVWEILMSH
jgi:hypothetical protein